MPIIKSAKKAARQAIKRKAKNEAIKKEITSTRKAVAKDPSAKNLSAAQSAIDKAYKKGLIKKNTASRRKAKLAKLAKALSGAKPAKKAASKYRPAHKAYWYAAESGVPYASPLIPAKYPDILP